MPLNKNKDAPENNESVIVALVGVIVLALIFLLIVLGAALACRDILFSVLGIPLLFAPF